MVILPILIYSFFRFIPLDFICIVMQAVHIRSWLVITLLMNSACRRISACDVTFVQCYLHHWSSAVRVCQPSATELFLLPPHTCGTVCRST